MNKELIILLCLGGIAIFHKQILSFLNKRGDKAFYYFMISEESRPIIQSEQFKQFSQTSTFDKLIDTLTEEQVLQIKNKL